MKYKNKLIITLIYENYMNIKSASKSFEISQI